MKLNSCKILGKVKTEATKAHLDGKKEPSTNQQCGRHYVNRPVTHGLPDSIVQLCSQETLEMCPFAAKLTI